MSSSQSTKKARRSAGVCVDCGSGTYLGSTRCGRCRNKDGIYQKRMTSRRVADGLCPCGRARPTVGRSCIDCWFYDIVRRRTGTAQHVGAMRKLWELQQGKCAYLGVALVPGGNASIDHMTPLTDAASVLTVPIGKTPSLTPTPGSLLLLREVVAHLSVLRPRETNSRRGRSRAGRYTRAL
jgi:hypothetical protein